MASQTSSQTESLGPIGSGIKFLRDCKEELGKVSRPTRDETVKATLTTLFIVVFMSAALALMDVLFNAIMKAVL